MQLTIGYSSLADSPEANAEDDTKFCIVRIGRPVKTLHYSIAVLPADASDKVEPPPRRLE
jgi:hypothetical protein